MNPVNQLKAVLKASGWSQEELARRLDVSFVTLNTWVNGRSQPRQAARQAISLLYAEIIGSSQADADQLHQLEAALRHRPVKLRQLTGDEQILDKLVLHLTYHTNAIEGSTMTIDDAEEVLFNNKVLTNRTQIEQAEAQNHRAALLWLLSELGRPDFHLNTEVVCGLHLRLMNGIIDNAGEYRRHNVRIMGTRVPVANYHRVPELIDTFVRRLQRSPKHLVRELAATHADFEKIHPFSDGNGRVGRLLMLAQSLQAGQMPPLVLRERRQAYYKYLELAQVDDKPLPLELFLAESMLAAHELLLGA